MPYRGDEAWFCESFFWRGKEAPNAGKNVRGTELGILVVMTDNCVHRHHAHRDDRIEPLLEKMNAKKRFVTTPRPSSTQLRSTAQTKAKD